MKLGLCRVKSTLGFANSLQHEIRMNDLITDVQLQTPTTPTHQWPPSHTPVIAVVDSSSSLLTCFSGLFQLLNESILIVNKFVGEGDHGKISCASLKASASAAGRDMSHSAVLVIEHRRLHRWVLCGAAFSITHVVSLDD